jgi:hypothetical protein
MALSICLIGFAEYKKHNKNKVAYLITSIVIAALFHYSALITLGWFLIPRFKAERRTLFAIATLGSIVYFLLPILLSIAYRIVPAFAGMYRGSSFVSSNYFGSIIESLRLFAVFILLLECEKRGMRKDVECSKEVTAILIALILELYSTRINILARLVPYYSIFEIIAVPNALNRVKGRNRLYLTIMVVFISFCYFSIVAIFRPGWHGAIPYAFGSIVD